MMPLGGYRDAGEAGKSSS